MVGQFARTASFYNSKLAHDSSQLLSQKEVIKILSLPGGRIRPFVRSHISGKGLIALSLVPVLYGHSRGRPSLRGIHLLDKGRLRLLVPGHGVQDDPLCSQGLEGGDMLDEAHRLPPETVALEAPGDVEAGDPDDPVVCEV